MHSLRQGISLLCSLLLTGCVVADMDSTNYTSVPYAQTFQKAGEFGHTDRQQRKVDLYACGVSKAKLLNENSWGRNVPEPGETTTDMRSRIAKVESCMESKGYILLDYSDCGPLKAPTGKCN